jgi:hypothetical protein
MTLTINQFSSSARRVLFSFDREGTTYRKKNAAHLIGHNQTQSAFSIFFSSSPLQSMRLEIQKSGFKVKKRGGRKRNIEKKR